MNGTKCFFMRRSSSPPTCTYPMSISKRCEGGVPVEERNVAVVVEHGDRAPGSDRDALDAVQQADRDRIRADHRDHLAPGAGYRFRRHGYYSTARRRRIPRFRCLVCRRTFSRQTFRMDYRDHRPHLNAETFGERCAGLPQPAPDRLGRIQPFAHDARVLGSRSTAAADQTGPGIYPTLRKTRVCRSEFRIA